MINYVHRVNIYDEVFWMNHANGKLPLIAKKDVEMVWTSQILLTLIINMLFDIKFKGFGLPCLTTATSQMS